jgi:hypothetical protein
MRGLAQKRPLGFQMSSLTSSRYSYYILHVDHALHDPGYYTMDSDFMVLEYYTEQDDRRMTLDILTRPSPTMRLANAYHKLSRLTKIDGKL